ncbi:ethanolamine ammonia-lyase subunit EutC [Nitratidesulfovibrio termitidis]|uniref:ethanolamine ammonia-lyase subunit EutC n=1 Tax=Nitratidesulfovibrio termitidis TaxID=42252 RepID=UPI0003F8BB67|nr:ethanolamine ammonia-lyase subunit EutC [Nitratidesulfovibrio termitidis]
MLTPFDMAGVRAALEQGGVQCLELHSAATDTAEFLARPDKGRQLSDDSREALREAADATTSGAKGAKGAKGADICVVISSGLSARAVHENAAPFALRFLEQARSSGYTTTPVALVDHGRVAVADEVAHLLGARLVVMLIGERPGLSSPNSLGVYLTHSPAPGCTDEARNCISNVRPGGLAMEEGVRKLCYLVQGAFAAGLTGVNLKDDMPGDYLPFAPAQALTDLTDLTD